MKKLEDKQKVEFNFNAERMLSDAGKGILKTVLFNIDRVVIFCRISFLFPLLILTTLPMDSEWTEVDLCDELQQESLTVNLGNQLKISHLCVLTFVWCAAI